MGERIVVGVDDSAGGRAALAYALREGSLRDAEVEVIGAFALPDFWSGRAVPGWSMGPAAEDIRREVSQRLDEVVAEVRAHVAQVPTVLRVRAVGGNAAAVLLEAARGAALLVVGNRGRGGVASAMLGSVSLQCVLHACCPVTVVPGAVVETNAARHEAATATS